jgi:hypothetical protein
LNLQRGCTLHNKSAMRALKHVAGILLATIGVAFTMGAIALLLDKEPLDAFFVVTFVLLAVVPLVCSFLLLRRKPGELPSRQCPTCGSTQHTQAGVLTPHTRLWLIPLVGWAMAALWGGSRPRQIRCSQCDTLYFAQTGASHLAGIVLWIFILLTLLGAIAYIFDIK